ncbi:hypothetical protein N7462_000426 [Penicillium macrosclerotiorum]|uniref:uncharacterized protein n=1 Tax=Penicillium macrosclerotiorum TaxID=303699 RepID=UPI0025495716|nr:uncharacterized protein N7462_000426 [Penicillium macrosclerotiorum]KAJ5698421.1 hypothetical protein N7462_000426 [Penicillium macrosclerotiorum]
MPRAPHSKLNKTCRIATVRGLQPNTTLSCAWCHAWGNWGQQRPRASLYSPSSHGLRYQPLQGAGLLTLRRAIRHSGMVSSILGNGSRYHNQGSSAHGGADHVVVHALGITDRAVSFACAESTSRTTPGSPARNRR